MLEDHKCERSKDCKITLKLEKMSSTHCTTGTIKSTQNCPDINYCNECTLGTINYDDTIASLWLLLFCVCADCIPCHGSICKDAKCNIPISRFPIGDVPPDCHAKSTKCDHPLGAYVGAGLIGVRSHLQLRRWPTIWPRLLAIISQI